MGRHSAPDDRDGGVDVDPTEATLVLTETNHDGRHSVADGSIADQLFGGADATAAGEQLDDAVPAALPPGAPLDDETEPKKARKRQPRKEKAPKEKTPTEKAAKRPAGPHSTAADLALVRSHRELLARCLAAVIVPFGIYVVVLLAVGAQARTFLLFVFIPLITAGLLVGALLDAAHRRQDRAASAPVDPDQPDVPEIDHSDDDSDVDDSGVRGKSPSPQ